MAQTPYSDLITDVLPHLAADPSYPVTELAIKRVAIDFCRQSWIWRHLCDPQSLLANVAEYDLDFPSAAEVVKVLSVRANGLDLEPSADVMPNEGNVGVPRQFYQLDTSTLHITPVPDMNVVNGLMVSLALQPSLRATGLPSWIASRYVDGLVSGAIARLMLMPGKPWTDLNAGVYHQARFEAAVATARADAVHGLGRAITRTKSQH